MAGLVDFFLHPIKRAPSKPILADVGAPASLIDPNQRFPAAKLVFRDIQSEAAFLRSMISRATESLALKEKALDIVREAECPSRDEECQALALGAWVQENIYYVHEGIQFFQRPATTLRLGAGLCVDFTILICSMLEILGIPSRMILMRINGKWRHIFPVAIVHVRGHGTHRIPLDATLRLEEHPIEEMTSPVELAQARGDTVELLEA